MTEIKLEELSNEELLKREKMASVVCYAFMAMVVIMLASAIFATYKKGFSAISVMPIAFLPLLLINLRSIKKIKAERKLRGL